MINFTVGWLVGLLVGEVREVCGVGFGFFFRRIFGIIRLLNPHVPNYTYLWYHMIAISCVNYGAHSSSRSTHWRRAGNWARIYHPQVDPDTVGFGCVGGRFVINSFRKTETQYSVIYCEENQGWRCWIHNSPLGAEPGSIKPVNVLFIAFGTPSVSDGSTISTNTQPKWGTIGNILCRGVFVVFRTEI